MTETVALYARVSSDEQREQQTIQTQLEYARRRIALEGWTFREFCDDGVSGTVPFAERPGGRALLAAARAGEFSLVVTYRVDRLGRELRILLDAIDALKAAGAHYRSLTEPFEAGTPFGDAALQMAGTFAQLELNTLKQRMRDGKKRVAQYDNRRLTGVVPYGYAGMEQGREKLLVVEPREAEIVRLIFAWRVEGWSPRKIAEELNRRGAPTHADSPGKRKKAVDKIGRRSKLTAWERRTVSRILRSEIYAGRASFFKASKTTEVSYRSVPEIIDAATFLAAREAVGRAKRFGGTHQSPTYDYRLRGMVRCGRCGHTMGGRQWRTRQGYYCQGCPAGERAFVPEDQILAVLWRDVLQFLAHPDQTIRALARAATTAGMSEDRAEQELMTLAQRARELDFQESQLVDMRLARTITPAIYDEKFKALSVSRQHLDLQRQAVRDERAAAARATTETEAARKLLGSLREVAERRGSDPTARAVIVRTVTRAIAVHVTNKRPRLHVTYAFGRPSLLDSPVSTGGPDLS